MSQNSISAKWISWAPCFHSILRIVAAITFMTYGTMKLWGYPVGMPPGFEATAFSQIWFAGVLEVFGGLLILLGFFTRPVAFLLAGEMAIAYFQGHAGNGFWPLANGGTDAVLYCFIWLYYSAAGAGKWSIDALMKRRSSTPSL